MLATLTQCLLQLFQRIKYPYFLFLFFFENGGIFRTGNWVGLRSTTDSGEAPPPLLLLLLLLN
jgi:hypothetical protein